MDDQTFHQRADDALKRLFRVLTAAAEEHGFEPDMNAGALTVEFEDPPGKFVVSPNSPVRQIWVSANVKSYKLDWEEGRGGFVLPSSGQSLDELIAEAIGTHLGEPVRL
jgi:CyaY protein